MTIKVKSLMLSFLYVARLTKQLLLYLNVLSSGLNVDQNHRWIIFNKLKYNKNNNITIQVSWF